MKQLANSSRCTKLICCQICSASVESSLELTPLAVSYGQALTVLGCLDCLSLSVRHGLGALDIRALVLN
jgi:hypothetical protein